MKNRQNNKINTRNKKNIHAAVYQRMYKVALGLPYFFWHPAGTHPLTSRSLLLMRIPC